MNDRLQATVRCVEGTLPPRAHLSNEPWDGRGTWPARWIACAEARATPWVAAFRLRVHLHEPLRFRVRVSADERYELFVDGVRVGRGPERGDPWHWHFETYAVELGAGEHTLAARTWALGRQAPLAQLSATPGFLFSPEDDALAERLATGARRGRRVLFVDTPSPMRCRPGGLEHGSRSMAANSRGDLKLAPAVTGSQRSTGGGRATT